MTDAELIREQLRRTQAQLLELRSQLRLAHAWGRRLAEDLDGVVRAAREVEPSIESAQGAAFLLGHVSVDPSGLCRVCGCTDDAACMPFGCAWANPQLTLCTACEDRDERGASPCPS